MGTRQFKIESVFSKWLAKEARALAGQGKIKIIEVSDFPEGAPLHEDGSTTYDPRKPLVMFAVKLDDAAAIATWRKTCRAYEKMISN